MNSEVNVEQMNLFLESLPSPIKECEKIKSLFGKCYSVLKDDREYVINNFYKCFNSEKINEEDKNKLMAAYVDVMYKTYNYSEAEKINNILSNKDISDFIINFQIGEYFLMTRRYDKAKYYIDKSIKNCNNHEYDLLLSNKVNEIKDRMYGKGYYPSSYENKVKYYEFMTSLGIKVDKPVTKKVTNKISKEDYPQPIEIKEAIFDTFVAFDVETTGFDSSRDSIIELSAIRVVNGKIIESKEFIFSELISPYKTKIHENVEKVTGITNEMLKDKRQIWDVFKDFKAWLKDDILVGYNCMNFDSKFLVRAGRLSNTIMTNKYFDVMKYAKKFSSKLNSNNLKLSTLAACLNIQNENAHRALSDAITTAKVYLKLKENEKHK